jgi:hypothetical protein
MIQTVTNRIQQRLLFPVQNEPDPNLREEINAHHSIV